MTRACASARTACKTIAGEVPPLGLPIAAAGRCCAPEQDAYTVISRAYLSETQSPILLRRPAILICFKSVRRGHASHPLTVRGSSATTDNQPRADARVLR